MKDNDKPMGNKNPTIQSMLEHLAKETILPEKVDLWTAVRADLAASKPPLQPKELSMNKRFIFTALPLRFASGIIMAAVLVLSVVIVFTANSVTAVSAKEVLYKCMLLMDRMYTIQIA